MVREIGENIIDFLSQIEDFQKRLWEKKKFVLKTEYVITTDRIFLPCHSERSEEYLKYFSDEIFKNKDQKKEWEELGFEIPKAKQDLKERTLPIDTKYFSQEFKEKLLEKLTEGSHNDEAIPLDDQLDGILIKSENWQALNLLLGKYKENVKCIYIDPPYNTGNDEFLYRDRYQHSSWLTMMENRLKLARELMSNDGVIFINIDDNERYHLEKLAFYLFGENNLIGPIIVQVNKGGRDYLPIAKQQEYVICCTFDDSTEMIRERDISEFKYEDLKGKFSPRELRNRNPKFSRKNRPNLYYPFFVDPNNKDRNGFYAVSLKKTEYHVIETVPKNKKGEDSCWRWGKETVMRNLNSDKPQKSEVVAHRKKDGGWNICEKYRGILFLDMKLRKLG